MLFYSYYDTPNKIFSAVGETKSQQGIYMKIPRAAEKARSDSRESNADQFVSQKLR